MTKIGRNDPCPCGSGKKFKKCCLPRQQASAETKSLEPTTPQPSMVWVDDDDDDLDDLSNSVIDLIDQGKLDEAERASKELLERFPEVPDGLERMAMVCEARGDYALAADYYRKSVAFIHGKDGYDPEIVEHFTKKAKAMEKKAKPG